MDERWWPFLWLLGAVGGYTLFMHQHPLRAAFATARQFTRNNFSIIAGLAGLLIAAVTWQFWQAEGLGNDNESGLSLTTKSDLLGWLPLANEDLGSLFWHCVPLDMAFVIGTPVAFLTCWYWIPRLWRACTNGRQWIAAMLVGIYALTVWWWSGRLCALLQLDIQTVPEMPGLRTLLSGIGELVFAVILACFIQLVILLGAYRSHGSGNARCNLKEALDWGLKCYPRVLIVPLIVLSAAALNWLVEDRLDLESASVWEAIKLVALLLTGALPICALLLQDLNPWESFLASLRFLGRSSWRYAWFLFLCLTHFFLLRLIESYLLTTVLTHQIAAQVWHVVAAILRAALVIWFINAWCLYFCIDVIQRQKGKKTSSLQPMKLAILQARTRKRKNLLSRLPLS